MKFESKFKGVLLLACLGFSTATVNAQYLKEGNIEVGNGGTSFRVSSWTAGTNYSADDNFFISRVKPKARFYNANTQVNPDFKPWWMFDKSATNIDYTKYSKKLLMWTPIGSKKTGNSYYTTIPNGLFNEEMFSMWQYVSTWGTWTDDFMRVPGNFVDVAHKNGVAVTTQISPAWNSNLADSENNWWSVIDNMNSNSENTLNCLDWYGLDGFGYNSEWSSNKTSDFSSKLAVVEKLNNVIAKHFDDKYKSKGLPSFSAENIWYDGMTTSYGPSFDHGINSATDVFFGDSTATANNKRTSFFYNYNWNENKQSYGSAQVYVETSASNAIKMGRNPLDLYAGFNLQGKEPKLDDSGNGSKTWEYIRDKGASIGLWSGHDSNVFWETRNSNGSDPEKAQGTYQRVLERWFSGSKYNPSPKIEGLDITASMSSDPNDDFFGMAKFVAAQSTLSWDLKEEPFVTYFNVGNGKFFNWKGKAANKAEWSNIGIQDYLPTWRWWWSDGLLNGDENNKTVPTGMTAELAWNAAYFGGSSMRIKGTCDNAVLNLFKTNFEIKAGDNIKISYQLNNGSADEIEFLLGDTDGKEVNSGEGLKIDTKDAAIGTWKTTTITAEAIPGGKKIGVLALKFTNAQNLDINIGQLSITRPNNNYGLESFKPGDVNEALTTTNHAIEIDKAELLGTTMYGIDGKVIFHLGENASTLEGHYNADHKVSMFNIYTKVTYTYTENGETKTKTTTTLMGSTTSWAGLFFKAPYDTEIASKADNVKLQIGVGAVAADMTTESDIKWSKEINVDIKKDYKVNDDITVSSELILGGDEFTAGYADPRHEESYWVLRGPCSGTNSYNSQMYTYVGKGRTFAAAASGKELGTETTLDIKSLPYGTYDLIAYTTEDAARKAVAEKASHGDQFNYIHLLPAFIQIYNSQAGMPVIEKFVALDNDDSDAISAVTQGTAEATYFAKLYENAEGKWNYHFIWGDTQTKLEDDGYETLPGAGIKVKPNTPLTLKFEAQSNVAGDISKGISLDDKALGVEAKSLGLTAKQQPFTVAFWLKIKSINGPTWLLNVRNPEEEKWPNRAWGWLWSRLNADGTFTNITVRTATSGGEVHFNYDDVKFEKNAWYHVAFVVNPTATTADKIQLYVNGVLRKTSSTDITSTTSFVDFNHGYYVSSTGTSSTKTFTEGTFKGGNTIQIGGMAGKGNFAGFDGTIDNFQVYNAALDQNGILTSMMDLSTTMIADDNSGFMQAVYIKNVPNLVGFWNFEDTETYNDGYANEVTYNDASKDAKLLRFQYPVDNVDEDVQTKVIAPATTSVGYPAINRGISKQDVTDEYEIIGSKSYNLVETAKNGAEVGGAEGSLSVQSSATQAAPAKIKAKKAKMSGDKYVGYAEVTFPNLNVKREDGRGYSDITLAVYTAKLKLTNSVGTAEALYKYIYVLDYDGGITTSVDNVKVEELSICPMKNGAIFTCGEETAVNVFDLNGRQVKAFKLGGSEFVTLAPGVYVANGKKFIVK